MLFNSFEFLLFFPIVTLLYFLLPHKLRWFHLLVASCIFYMAFVPVYIFILFFTIIVDYVAGILIEGAAGPRRRLFLIMSIVVNVGLLAIFKYYNFFAGDINRLLTFSDSQARLGLLRFVLPIGLSFHTFQAMSYTIEVYRGKQKAERHLGIYALYVMFYPQLVAGPIERPQNLLHQFHERHEANYDDIVAGLRMMMVGMVKKVVVADRLALLTDPIFDHPHGYSGTTLLVAIFFFAFQIYCDFSGYSDIALGAARVMGFKLMTNFNLPFESKSITEFWRRWHISLSTWFYDYVFNPVVTTLRDWGKGAVVFGLMLTFTLSGFWHGAGWQFVIFGVLHGLAVVYEFFTKKKRKKLFGKLPLWLNNGLSKVLTFSFACFTWIFFRARHVGDAFYIIRKLGKIPQELARVAATGKIYFLNLPGLMNVVLPGFCLIILLEIANTIYSRYRLRDTFSSRPMLFRWSFYFLSQVALIYFGVYEKHQFIYFQF